MWLYLPACCRSSLDTAGSTSPPTRLFETLERSATWRGKLSASRSWQRAWKRAIWMRRLFGEMSPPSTVAPGVVQWILSLAASRARTSAPLELAQESTASARGSGASTLASFARFDPATSSWRTAQRSLFEDSTACSPIWPRSGWMRSGMCGERPTSARPMSGPGCSSSPDYPTPSASSYGTSQNGINGKDGMFKRPSAGTPSLETMARKGMFPTPRATRSYRDERHGKTYEGLHSIARNRPTPTTAEASRGAGDSPKRQGSANLSTEVLYGLPESETPKAGADGLALNPLFVEALMGLPIGWTDLEPWATASSGNRPHSPSECSRSG
jgi:hypothetical protein